MVGTASSRGEPQESGDKDDGNTISTSTIIQAPQFVIERSSQLGRHSIDGLLHVLRFIGHSDGLFSLQSRFHNATFVWATFVPVLVAEVDFHPDNLLG